MKKEFVPYEQALALKELGFDEPCMYAWCITLEHRIEYDGKMSLKTDGNPFGQFYKGKSFNGKYSPNKNKIQCSAPTFSQAFRWFRDKYNLHAEISWSPSYEYDSGKWSDAIYEITITNVSYTKEWVAESPDMQRANGKQLTYEEAELACLDKLIEIVKFKLE